MGKFDGRVAIITGGGKGGGIGYGLSTAFAKEGCNLVITGRNTKKLDDAKEELERLCGVKVLACQADGGVEEQVAALVKQAADTLGRIDFLINNAQSSASGVPLAEHTKETVSPTKTLSDRELTLIFDYLTQHNQVDSIESIYADVYHEPKKEACLLYTSPSPRD